MKVLYKLLHNANSCSDDVDVASVQPTPRDYH